MSKMIDSDYYWIGKTPEHWNYYRVKNAFYRKKAKAFQQDPIVLALSRDAVKIRDITTNEGQLAADYSEYNPVDIGDFLINPMDLYSGANCNVSKVQGVISPAYVNLKGYKNINPYFYDYYFKHLYTSMTLFSHGIGVSYDNRWTLNDFALMNIKIPNLPLKTQNLIVNFLNDKCGMLDTLIANEENIISELKEYKKAITYKTVTKGISKNTRLKDSNTSWIGNIPTNWVVTQFGKIAKHNTGKALNEKSKNGTPMRYITTSNLYWNEFRLEELPEMKFKDVEIERYTAKKGDLLICEGGDIGRSAIWNFDYPILLQNHIHRVRTYSHISTKFIFYCMYAIVQTGAIRELDKGIGLQGLSSKALSRIKLPIPPFAEQKAIADYLDKKTKEVDKLIAIKQQKIVELKDYKKSLIYEYVTGKKEVV